MKENKNINETSEPQTDVSVRFEADVIRLLALVDKLSKQNV